MVHWWFTEQEHPVRVLDIALLFSALIYPLMYYSDPRCFSTRRHICNQIEKMGACCFFQSLIRWSKMSATLCMLAFQKLQWGLCDKSQKTEIENWYRFLAAYYHYFVKQFPLTSLQTAETFQILQRLHLFQSTRSSEIHFSFKKKGWQLELMIANSGGSCPCSHLLH